MEIIEFNGLGQPRDARYGTGTIAILVQGASISVVRIELLAPEEYGPSLSHARNDMELQSAVRQSLANAYPKGLDSSRHWVLTCPEEIAARAMF
ncbi:hypothetical protein V8J88_21470 [Massilia sp. W12]|uniref:hypothetical protein n=1 Tax=Massilia sp. W12 TaxID=3126507 RepID=UPI0030D0D2B7